jgi:transposase
VRHRLTHPLVTGQIVVLDNLSVHKGERVREVLAGFGCTVRFLPADSPDLSPIEGMFSKVKQALRRAGKRIQEELVMAIGAALGTVTTQGVAGWFAHCGCPPHKDQSL